MYLYKNREEPWKAIYIQKQAYSKPFIYHVGDRLICINLFLVSLFKDGCKIRLGVGFGRIHYTITFQY